jgi:alpha/beta hydrolase fold
MTRTRKRTVRLCLLGNLQWRGVAPFLLTFTMTFITMAHAFPSPRYHYHHHHYSHHPNHQSHPTIETETALKATHTFVNLHYMEFSTPTPVSVSLSLEPPVLFLHGLLGSKRNFASLGASLASQLDSKRRILAMDLRNHGTTPPKRYPNTCPPCSEVNPPFPTQSLILIALLQVSLFFKI